MTYPPGSTAVPDTGATWQTVWHDSFSGVAGHAPSAANWKYDTGQGVFGTGEIETMTDSLENVHLDGNGNLDVTALRQGGLWTSGRIQTRQLFSAAAGGELRVMASIRPPDPVAGLGYWPAFWLLGPGRWPATGEIDAFEDVNTLSEHSGSFHCGNLTSRNSDGTFGRCHEKTGLTTGLLACDGCQGGYHTFSVIIDRRNPADEQIDWYLDGREFFTVRESRVGTQVWERAVDHGFSIILDLAMGGAYPDGTCGCVTPTGQTTTGGTMRVRYVGVSRR